MARRHRNRDIGNAATQYEKLIEDVLASAYRASDNPESVFIQRNARIAGSTRDENGRPVLHEIDIYLELRTPLITHKIVVQAKHWRTRVKKEQVLSFAQILGDIPGQPRGIMISYAGFQIGAVRYAKAHGIELFVLQNLLDSPESVTRIAPAENSYFNYAFYPAALECESREGVVVILNFKSQLLRAEDVEVSGEAGWSSIDQIANELRRGFLDDILHAAEKVPRSGYRYVDFTNGPQYRINGSDPAGIAKSLRLEFVYEQSKAPFDFSVSGSFEHFFSNVLTGKEWLVDLSGSPYDKATLGICDFCNVALAEDQGTDFGCPDIIVESATTNSEYAFVSDWGACVQCALLVKNKDQNGLLTRALLLISSEPGFNNRALPGIRRAHEFFWQHNDGTCKPRMRSTSIEM